MATEPGYIDAQKAVQIVSDHFENAHGQKLPAELFDGLKDEFISHFTAFNQAYADLKLRVNDSRSQATAYLEKKVEDLEQERDDLEELHNRQIAAINAGWRKERDDAANRADAERERLEKEKEKINKKKKEAQEKLSAYKLQVKRAKDEEEAAIKALEEEREQVQILKERLNSVEKARTEAEREGNSWEIEAHDAGKLRMQAIGELNTCRTKLDNERLVTGSLGEQIEQLSSELQASKEALVQKEKDLDECQTKLLDTQEDLAKYRPSSAMGSVSSTSPIKGSTLKEQLRGNLGTPSPVSSTKSTSSPILDLARAHSKIKDLEEKVENLEQALSDKTKELEAARSEKSSVKKAEDDCQSALKKIKDELAQKVKDGKDDDATIKDLRAQIKELQKKVAQLESESNSLKREAVKHKERILDQEKQLKQNKDKISKLEQSERKQQTMIANHQTEQKAKDKENKKLSDDLKHTQKDLEEVQRQVKADNAELQKQRAALASKEESHKTLQDQVSLAEMERDEFEVRLYAMQKHLDQHEQAEDILYKELMEAERLRAALYDTVQSMLTPDINTDRIGQTLSRSVTNLIDLRNSTLKAQEELIPIAQAAARDYLKLTGKKLVIEGQDSSDPNRRSITDAKHFGKSVNALYEGFADSLRQAQDEVNKLKEEAGNTKELQDKIDVLEKRKNELGSLLKEAQDNAAKADNPGADGDEISKKIRNLLKIFLDIAGPTTKDIDNLLVELINAQKQVPGATPFGADAEKLAKDLELVRSQLEDAEGKSKGLAKEVEEHKSARKQRGSEFEKIQQENQKHREEIKKLRKQLDTVSQNLKESNRENKETNRHINVLNDSVNMLEKEANDHMTEIRNLRSQSVEISKEREKCQTRIGELTTYINKIKEEKAKLQEDKEAALRTTDSKTEEALRERDDANEKISKLKAEIAELQATITTVAARNEATGNANNNNTDDARITDLRNKNSDLELKIATLEDDIETVNAERAALRTQLSEQSNIIGGNGQQADRTQAALNKEIVKLEAQQGELNKSLEAMSQRTISQGLSAADTNRSLEAARKEVARLQNMQQALIVERDLLQDEVRLCVQAQKDARARRNNQQNPGAGDGAGAAPGPIDGGGSGPPDKPNFFSRTANIFVETVQYGTVYSILVATFFMMVAVIIAEGRLYGQWRVANSHTRALFASTYDRPTLCLGMPMMNYFWHTLAAALLGRWKFA